MQVCFISPHFWGVRIKKLRWTGLMECMEDRKEKYMVLIISDGKPKLEVLGLNRIILKGSARRGVTAWTVLIVVVKL
jgi:hypothetical protein